MTIMFCANCERIIHEGSHLRQALDARDIHEFNHDHIVVEFEEIAERLVRITETVEVRMLEVVEV
jgi:hypothetical protein